MLDVQLFLCLLLSVAQLLSGILANGIILAGNGIDLVKRKMWNSLSLLLSCLAIVRIIIQVLFFYMALAFLSLVEFPMVERYFVVCMFIEELGLWFATWLGVFYCAKIANISHPIFFWLKRRISKLVPWLILGSVLYASVILIGHSQHTSKIFKQILLSFLSNNGTNQNKQDFAYPYTIFIIGLSLPLFIFLTAVLLLVISLGRHTRQMRFMGNGRNPSRSIPLSAVLSILSFLILYLSHYVAGMVFVFQILHEGNLIFQRFFFLVGTYPAAHSIILILGNPQLKKNIQMLFLYGRHHP